MTQYDAKVVALFRTLLAMAGVSSAARASFKPEGTGGPARRQPFPTQPESLQLSWTLPSPGGGGVPPQGTPWRRPSRPRRRCTARYCGGSPSPRCRRRGTCGAPTPAPPPGPPPAPEPPMRMRRTSLTHSAVSLCECTPLIQDASQVSSDLCHVLRCAAVFGSHLFPSFFFLSEPSSFFICFPFLSQAAPNSARGPSLCSPLLRNSHHRASTIRWVATGLVF